MVQALRLYTGRMRQDALLETGTTALLYAVALYFYILSVQLPEYGEVTEPATVPLTLSLLLAILALLGSLQWIFRSYDSDEKSVDQEPLRPLRVFFVFGLSCAYLFSLSILGYFTATIPFLFFVSLILRDRALPAFGIALGWCCFVYLIFQCLLGVSLPEASWIS